MSPWIFGYANCPMCVQAAAERAFVAALREHSLRSLFALLSANRVSSRARAAIEREIERRVPEALR